MTNAEDTTEKKTKKKRKSAGAKRMERRFLPVAATNPWIVRVLGALGALALGAGIYGYLYASGEGHAFAEDASDKMRSIPSYLIAGGAVIMGLCIWLGTSGEAPVRVGDPGIAVERGETRRMPWWAIEKISWQSGALALIVSGRDESFRDWTFKVPLKAHPEAVGWIVAEAKRRIPKKLEMDRGLLKNMPPAREHAGTRIELEPLQVVGRKCAASGKTISYEPDARVCPRCERVYFKRSVPNKCKCGAEIGHLRPTGVTAPEDVDEDDEESEEAEGTEAEHEAEHEEKASEDAETT